MEDNNKTYEFCPHCDTEVELDADLKVQRCPNCGKHIVTCSMCHAYNCDIGIDTDGFCTHCCLVLRADLLDLQELREKEVLSAK